MKLTTDDFRLLNTIYIISKGRPDCLTAQTLKKLNYPGKWFIVCGNNDETLPAYKKNWGKHVLVFDWYEEIKHTDTLDNFGFEKMASGAVPVRNATIRISKERGEKRHWQLDDDYRSFWLTDIDLKHKTRIDDGAKLQWWMCRIAKFADGCCLPNCGFALGTIESAPDNGLKLGTRVFNAHNQSSTGLATKWRSRLNDDLINAIETHRLGKKTEFSLLFLALTMPPSQQEEGGLSDIYRAEGTVRKSAYPILLAPNATRLIIKFGRYHHKVDWKKIRAKIISEKWKRE